MPLFTELLSSMEFPEVRGEFVPIASFLRRHLSLSLFRFSFPEAVGRASSNEREQAS
jgi:hypothetical protein